MYISKLFCILKYFQLVKQVYHTVNNKTLYGKTIDTIIIYLKIRLLACLIFPDLSATDHGFHQSVHLSQSESVLMSNRFSNAGNLLCMFVNNNKHSTKNTN